MSEKIKFKLKDGTAALKELNSVPKYKNLFLFNILSHAAAVTAGLGGVCWILLVAVVFIFLGLLPKSLETSTLYILFGICIAMAVVMCIALLFLFVDLIYSAVSVSKTVKEMKNQQWSAREILRYNMLIRVSRTTVRKFTIISEVVLALLFSFGAAIFLVIIDIFFMFLSKEIARAGIERAYLEGIFSPSEAQYYNDNCSKFFNDINVSVEMQRRVEEFEYMKNMNNLNNLNKQTY